MADCKVSLGAKLVNQGHAALGDYGQAFISTLVRH